MIKKKINKLINMIKNNKTICLFFLSFTYLVILGLILTYNYNFQDDFNLLFGSDSSRVIGDMTDIGNNHYRATVHPLFIILIQTMIFLLRGIFIDKMIAAVVLSAFASSITVVFIYKTLNLINKNEKINSILSLIYLFSFSNIIFTAGMETYNFAALFLVILWYFYLKKANEKYTKTSYAILIMLGIFSFAFTITNIIIYLIVIILLVINKKISFKKCFSILILVLVSCISLNAVQRLAWNTAPILLEKSTMKTEKTYINHKIKITNIKNVVQKDYANSLISGNIKLNITSDDKYSGQNFELMLDNNIFSLFIIIIFYIGFGYLLFKGIKNKLLFFGLLAALGFNTTLHLIYGNESTFLYSLHFLYLIILLYGLNYNNLKNTKIKKLFFVLLSVFLLAEVIINNINFLKVLTYTDKILEGNYFVRNLGLPLTITFEVLGVIVAYIVINIFINIIKKILLTKSREEKLVYISCASMIVILTISIFIGIESLEGYDRLSRFNLNNNQQAKLINKENYLSEEFKEHFNPEFQKLTAYRTEIEELKSNYNVESTVIYSPFDYYFFGFGNRRKLMYSKGSLLDIDTKKVLYSFEPSEYMIIPNAYTIVARTNDDKYIKIYEDNKGVHYNINGKDEIIDGTEKEIELYSFDNQKYQNIKKELYSEILFNIKDSKIYPNIIAYDKPWYRDAAVAAMVLKQTNNTDLIKDWVKNIDTIYDEQNGQKEVDNLGELLYILSTQKDRNEDLIDEIEEEANRIAKENENGYYLIGKTDFGDMYIYQNLWYKLGIEAVGREFNFDLSSIPEDPYAKMTWWSDYDLKYQKPIDINEDYPYLTTAANHKLKTGTLVLNNSLYPLSWEKHGSSANYNNYLNLLPFCTEEEISPLHSWSAAEMLLFIMDETKDLELK